MPIEAHTHSEETFFESRRANKQQVNRGNVRMTPCDGTSESATWCCGSSRDCCSASGGSRVSLSANFTWGSTSSSSTPTPSLTQNPSSTQNSSSKQNPSSTQTRSSTQTSNSAQASQTRRRAALSGGAIAGIVVGVLTVVALCVGYVIWKRKTSSDDHETEATFVEELPAQEQKVYYMHEADAAESQRAELPATNVRDNQGHRGAQELP